MKKVAFYGRYSSNNQTEQSIEGQLHVCEDYAAKNGLQIVAQYIDRAATGTDDRRPQFQRMIADSAKGLFEGVLLYKLDRFARNRYHSAVYKHKLRENGVAVISAMEHLTDTPEGIMLEAVLEGMDEFYSAELSQKVNRGLSESFHKGYYLKKYPPFGYEIKNRKLVPHPQQAQLAADIFRRYAAGDRMTDIAAWLNGLGLRNGAGNAWRVMNISTHLKNRIYMGEYHYGQFADPMPCPALIEPELFERVQEKLRQSAHRRRQRSDYEYMLTGKLRCGFCGHSVSGTASRRGNHHYYYCRHCEQQNRQCYDADTLHARVLDALRKHLIPEKVEQLTDAAYAEYCKEQQPDERQTITAELARIETQLQRAVQAILEGYASETLKDTMNGLEARRDALRANLEALPQLPRFTHDHFKAIFDYITAQEPEAILRVIVNCILLRGEDVIICINLTDEANDPPMEQVLFKVKEGDHPHTQNKQWLLLAA